MVENAYLIQKSMTIEILTCIYCKKSGFKGTKGLATHRRYSSLCFSYWKEEQNKKQEERIKKGFVVCAICNQKFKTITNTHLKIHNLSMKEYINNYGKCFSEDLLITQNERRIKTINKRYTPEQIKFLKGEKAVKSKEKKNNKSYSEISKDCHQKFKRENTERYDELRKITSKRIKDFWSKLTPTERCDRNSIILKKRMSTNIIKYNTPFAQTTTEAKEKSKKTRKERYGDENYHNSKKSKETRYAKYGKYSNFFPNFSLKSQELFKMVEKQLPKDLICFYATNGSDKNNEFQVYYHGCDFVRFLDFYIPSINVWIEFNEEHHQHTHMKKKDSKRIKEIKTILKNPNLLVIKKETFLKNKLKVSQKCIKFINKYTNV